MLNFHQKTQSKKTLSFHYSTPKRFCQYVCLVLAIFSLFFVSSNTHATGTIRTNNFYFKDFTADYYLTRDTDGTSRMKVVENLTAVFPESNQNHGITRVIPFTNNDGKNLTMKSDMRRSAMILQAECIVVIMELWTILEYKINLFSAEIVIFA